jgi:hypothetical protein
MKGEKRKQLSFVVELQRLTVSQNTRIICPLIPTRLNIKQRHQSLLFNQTTQPQL